MLSLGLPASLSAEEHVRELSCGSESLRSEGRVLLYSEPVGLDTKIVAGQSHSAVPPCRVLHRPFGLPTLMPEMGAKPFDSIAGFDGVLQEAEDDDLPFFSALR